MDRTLTLLICGAVMLLLYIIALGLIFSDLWAGVRKAKVRGEFRTSDGYKKTIDKIARYFNMIFALSLVDIAQLSLIFFLYYFYRVDIWMVPWFTLFAVGYVAWVEVHSIWEPADVKERKQQEEYTRAIEQLIKQCGSVDAVLQAIKNKEEKNNG
jgi:hypothetical protein